MNQEKRHLYKRKRKRKFKRLKNTKQLVNYLKQKVKPQYEKVVLEPIKEENIMPKKETEKLLFILPADKAWVRILRRFVIIFVLGGFAAVGQDVANNEGVYFSATYLPLVVAFLAAIDKALRDKLKK